MGVIAAADLDADDLLGDFAFGQPPDWRACVGAAVCAAAEPWHVGVAGFVCGPHGSREPGATVIGDGDRGMEMGLLAKSVLAGQGLSSPFGVPTGPTAFIAPV